MKRLLFLIVLLTVASSANSAITSGARQQPHSYKNFLIIMLDDVGRKALGIDGASEQPAGFTTPEIDSLKADGVTMTNMYTASMCAATRAGVMLGWSAVRHMQSNGPSVEGINDAHDFWPEVVNGSRPVYEVGLFGKSGIGFSTTTTWNNTADSAPYGVEDGYPWFANREKKMGFDHFDGFGGTDAGYNTSWNRRTIDKTRTGYSESDSRTWWDYPCLESSGSLDRTNVDYDSYYPYYTGSTTCSDLVSETITDAARAWIISNDRKGTPWVAWVNYSSVHTPHTDPSTENSRWCTDASCSSLQQTGTNAEKMMYHVDKEIGLLVSSLQKEDTIVIILGDNGSVAQLGGGKSSMYETGNNVGAVLWGGPVKNPGRTTTALHAVSDFFPTILDLAGVDLPTGNVPNLSDDNRYDGQAVMFSGKSMMGTVRDEPNSGNDYTFGFRDGARMVRSQDYKYYNCECGGSCGDEVLVTVTGGDESVTNLCTSSSDCSNLSGADLAAYNGIRAALLVESQNINGSSATVSTCSVAPY